MNITHIHSRYSEKEHLVFKAFLFLFLILALFSSRTAFGSTRQSNEPYNIGEQIRDAQRDRKMEREAESARVERETAAVNEWRSELGAPRDRVYSIPSRECVKDTRNVRGC